ncbi:MAG: tetratricopeptide repeat protein, partial [Proteobacteria bacterium]|nr:tetratricopeptide repeat protein [Pseudomonadota bacterium]
AERNGLAALDRVERQSGPYDRRIADILSDLGSVYARQQRFKDAEGAFRRSREIDSKTRPADDPTSLGTIGNLANVLSAQMRYGEAEDLLRPALALADKPSPNHRRALALILHALSSIYQHQSRYQDSEPLLTREIAIIEALPRRPSEELNNALNNLALAKAERGDNPGAEQLLKRVYETDRKNFGERAWQTGVSLLNLGNTQRNLGRNDEAEQSFKVAAGIAEQQLGPQSIQLANALNNIADVYQRTGRARESVPYFKRAFTIYEGAVGPLAADVVRNLHGQARAAASNGDVAGALSLARDAARRVVERARAVGTVRHGGQTASPIAQQRFAFEDLLERLDAEAARTPRYADSLAREAFLVGQWPTQSLAGSAIQQMAVRFSEQSGELAGAVRELQDLDGRWLASEQRFKAALQQAGDARNVSAIESARRELAEIEGGQKALSERLAREFPGYSALTEPAPLSVPDVQRLLNAGEALVVIYSAPAGTYVWAIDPKRFASATVKITRQDLSRKIAALRQALDASPTQQGQRLFDPAAAHELYKLLLAPVENVVGNASHLIVVESGPLTGLPLHVLVTEPPAAIDYAADLARYRDVAWLAARQATSVLPTVSSLKALRTLAVSAAPAPLPLVGFANPVFGPLPASPRTSDSGPKRIRKSIRREKADVSPKLAPQTIARRGDVGAFQRYFRGLDPNFVALRQSLPPLPETEPELRAVAEHVGASPDSLKLG